MDTVTSFYVDLEQLCKKYDNTECPGLSILQTMMGLYCGRDIENMVKMAKKISLDAYGKILRKQFEEKKEKEEEKEEENEVD